MRGPVSLQPPATKPSIVSVISTIGETCFRGVSGRGRRRLTLRSRAQLLRARIRTAIRGSMQPRSEGLLSHDQVYGSPSSARVARVAWSFATRLSNHVARAATCRADLLVSRYCRSSSSNNADKDLVTGVDVEIQRPDDFHDRFWIADRARRVIVGAYEAGLGSKLIRIDDLAATDITSILEALSETSAKRVIALRVRTAVVLVGPLAHLLQPGALRELSGPVIRMRPDSHRCARCSLQDLQVFEHVLLVVLLGSQ